MKFYDMLIKCDDDIVKEIPFDIIDIIKDVKLPVITDTEKMLDDTWEKTKNICGKYIKTEWIKGIGMNEDDFLKDIKHHSIFIIYLSIISQTKEPKSIRKCTYENYQKKENRNKDILDLHNNFKKKWIKWLKLMEKINYNDVIFYSDFYYCFYIDTLNKNNKDEKKNDEYNIYIDSEIFYEVINNWKDCPYSKNHSKGMTFRKLDKFYERLDKIVNSSNDTIDKIIKAFTIERLFNISFLQKLSYYTQEKFKEEVNIEDTIIINKKNINIEAIEDNEIIIEKYSNFNKLPYTIAQQNGAARLLALSEIVSIPMAFSRNKYIDIINKAYENIHEEDYIWNVKLKHNLLYLNSYMIPLLLRVYYYLLLLYLKDNNKEINKQMEDIFKTYIESNTEYFNFKELVINKKDRYNLRNNLGTEAFQINVTEIIYNYIYDREVDTKNNDIFRIMESLDNVENINEEIIKSKYNWYRYQFNFPFNGIYSNYQISKNKKL